MAGFGDRRLNAGASPLSYMGVRPVTPAQFVTNKRAPTTTDYQGYSIGTQWLWVDAADATKSVQYVLSSVAENVATWLPLNSSDTATYPDHSVLLGTGTTTIGSVGPDATVGLPLVSAGLASDPVFNVLTVAGGGTGWDSLSEYAVLIGNVENPLIEANTVASIGVPLVSNGLFASPFFGAAQTVGGGTGLVGVDAYNLLIGAGGTSPLVKLPPSATVGQALVSTGNASNPGWGTVTVPGGGTGAITLTGVLIGNGAAAITGNPVTQYNTLIGGVANAISSIAPSATAGIPLVSNGAAANPSYTTAVVAGGGTGVVTMTTAYAPVCAGTTATGPLQVASTGMSNAGWVLTSTGLASLPTWQASGGGAGFSSINVQTFTTPGAGNYVPTAGMSYCVVECLGGGGGGGGCNNNGTSQTTASGGGAGGYCKSVFSAATIGAFQPLSVGAIGTGGNNTGGNGTSGGNTTFMGITASGGGGGIGESFAGTTGGEIGGLGGSAAGGTINISGSVGGVSFQSPGGTFYGFAGSGANSLYGSGGNWLVNTIAVGNVGTGYGSGGGGSMVFNGNGNAIGGNGTSGIIIITEFIG